MKEPKKIILTKKPWPTKDAMKQVYEMKLWGDNGTNFYSGAGSHDPKIVAPYIAAVSNFLNSFQEPLSVCDLGCGDFNIGKQLLPFTNNYLGIDIVPELIERNKTTFKAANLNFQCLDIATDSLPPADCIILRQVLQHLSNAEILKVVAKLHRYKYLILTEHLPTEIFSPNLDIISGQGIRIKKNSGVNVIAAPFHLRFEEVNELNRIPLGNGKGVVVSWIFRLKTSA